MKKPEIADDRCNLVREIKIVTPGTLVDLDGSSDDD